MDKTNTNPSFLSGSSKNTGLTKYGKKYGLWILFALGAISTYRNSVIIIEISNIWLSIVSLITFIFIGFTIKNRSKRLKKRRSDIILGIFSIVMIIFATIVIYCPITYATKTHIVLPKEEVKSQNSLWKVDVSYPSHNLEITKTFLIKTRNSKPINSFKIVSEVTFALTEKTVSLENLDFLKNTIIGSLEDPLGEWTKNYIVDKYQNPPNRIEAETPAKIIKLGDYQNQVLKDLRKRLIGKGLKVTHLKMRAVIEY
jgi:hypothetical protein